MIDKNALYIEDVKSMLKIYESLQTKINPFPENMRIIKSTLEQIVQEVEKGNYDHELVERLTNKIVRLSSMDIGMN